MSALGQPLRAEIELLAVQADELGTLEARLASSDAFRQARMERAGNLDNLQFAIGQKASGAPVLKISSTLPVSDPFMDLLIELNWNTGRILREYTVLLDPPTTPDTPRASGRTPMAVTAPVAVAAPPEGATLAPLDSAKPGGTKPKPQAESTPAEDKTTYGPVKAGETLSSIAAKVRHEDVSVEMMLASLYQANQKAFSKGNMNLLRKGRTLTVPDRDSVMRMFNPGQAKALVRDHGRAWNEYRSQVAAISQTLPKAVAETPQGESSKGKIVQAPEAPAVPAPAPKQDVLKLSKGQPAAEDKARTQALEEEVAAKNRALKESNERVAQLEKTIEDLQKLAQMQGQAARDAAATTGPAETPAQPAPDEAAAKPETPVVEAPVPPPPESEAQPGFLSQLLANPLYIAGGLGVVLLGGGLLFMRNKRRRKTMADFDQQILNSGDDFKTAIFRTTAGGTTQSQAPTSVMTDFSRLGLGAIDTHEVDPIAEAEVYMAYGRDAQAEEILKEALSKDPGRHEITLKLLEIYATRMDLQSFETQASELYAALGGQDSAIWNKAAELGRSIDPDNPLYQPREGSYPVAPEPMAFNSAAQDLEASSLDASKAMDDDVALGEKNDQPQFTTLDNLFQDDQPAEGAKQDASLAPASPAKDDDGALDFDLPLHPFADAEQKASASEASMDISDLDFDMGAQPEAGKSPFADALERDLGQMADGMAESANAIQDDIPDLDFSNIDLELKEDEASMPEMEAVPDLDALLEAPTQDRPASLDKAEGTSEPVEPGLPADDASPARPDALEETPQEVSTEDVIEATVPEAADEAEIDPELWEEVNTKLDLSQAYLEMGDKEGAREILQEILSEGDASQRAKATELMAQTD